MFSSRTRKILQKANNINNNKKTAINIENKENESDFIIIENYQTLEDGTLIMETVTSHHTINSEKCLEDENTMKNTTSRTVTREEISTSFSEDTEAGIITILQLETEKALQELKLTRKDILTLEKNNEFTPETEKIHDTELHTLVVTLDLQSVLTCPKVLASQSYYKMKLQLHNFTIYALNDKNVSLYVWDDASGGVTCDEFTSCLIDYLSHIPPNFKSVILISDGCNYQNRNKTLASALSDFAKEKDISIQQLYLEKGHTMMEADSVHSTLENYFLPTINSPIDYIARMRMARHKQPYCIKSLDYKFFKQYELAHNFPSIRPGKKTGDPVVVDIRQLKYSPSGDVWFTLDYSEDWNIMPHRRDCQNMSVYKTPLYRKQPTISYEKYQRLQEMKTIIEVDHHSFYDSLSYEKKKNK